MVLLVAAATGFADSAPPPPPEQGVVETGGKFVPKPPATGPDRPATLTRDQAEAVLRADLKIERLDANRLKLGLVTLDQAARTIRFPATVNMTKGPVEYVLVAAKGKVHESVFVTKTSIRDIHLAMLLLGVQPAAAVPGPDQTLKIPAGAAVNATVEWETNGPLASHPLAAMIALAEGDPDHPGLRTLRDGAWLYQGSCFDAYGFRALREGSVISLIGDDSALVNNPGSDRDNDDLHVPNATLLPRPGMPVSIIFTCPPTTPPTAPGPPPKTQ